MAINARTILTQLTSHAGTLGVFEDVIPNAPINPPQSGVVLFLEYGGSKPARSSGLNVTSVVMTWTATILLRLTEPYADVELAILAAADAYKAALSGDFDLGGQIRCVDLQGAESPGLTDDAGYLPMGDTLHRTVIVTIPLIVNDVYEQVA